MGYNISPQARAFDPRSFVEIRISVKSQSRSASSEDLKEDPMGIRIRAPPKQELVP
jgi:uncharacterized protein YggU (UPF0235/DUF167 family)